MSIELSALVGKTVPFGVRYAHNGRTEKPITVVGYGDAGLAPLAEGVRNTTACFAGGGWLWLPDLLRYYELVEGLDAPFDRVWFWRSTLPERKGQRCRILARGTMNSCLIEFEDGERHVVSRFAIRKAG